jgi:hypothetical protein
MVFLLPRGAFTNSKSAVNFLSAPQSALDVITSHFPKDILAKPKSKAGIPGSARNQFLVPEGKIHRYLLLSQKNPERDLQRCCLMITFVPRFTLLRAWRNPTHDEFNLIENFRLSMKTVLEQKLDSIEIDHFQSDEELLAKYPEFR